MKKPTDKEEPLVTWGRMTMCEVMPPCPQARGPAEAAEKTEDKVPAALAADEPRTEEVLDAVGTGSPAIP
jgi:hypothetical protein